MNNSFEKKTFKPSERLIREGDTSEAAFLIISGKVEVRKGDLGEHPQTLAVLGKGEVIGEMSLFDDTPPIASVIAVEETIVNTIYRDEFQRRVNTMDPVIKGVVKVMVKRIRKMSEGSGKKAAVNWIDWKQ